MLIEVYIMEKAVTRSSNRVMDATLKQQIGLALRAARKRGSLTQEELAERIGKSPEAISNIERGQALPTLGTLIDLSVALNEPLSRLVEGLSAESPKPANRLRLELQLRSVIDQLDDRTLEVALKQISALGELKR